MTELPPGTLLFDLDDTLVHSAGDLAGSLDTLMTEKGLPPVAIEIEQQLIGHDIANLVRGALRFRGASERENDVAAANAAVMSMIALTYGYAKMPLETLAPDALISSFADVPRAIDRTMNACR